MIEVEKEDLSVDQIACSAFNGLANLDLLKPQKENTCLIDSNVMDFAVGK